MLTPTRLDADAVVIGSGIGGLASASLLAQRRGWRVLVLERHFKAGGFTHSFRRDGFTWDVGLHYVGQLHPGSRLRRLVDTVAGRPVGWQPLPEPFDTYHHPGLTLRRRAGRQAYAEALLSAFPQHGAAIQGYLDDVVAVAAWVGPELASWSLPAPLIAAKGLVGRRARRLGLMTTDAYLKALTPDPRLRAVLATTWGDYGLPPERSAFAQHALIEAHYLDGAWYPEGGSDAVTAPIVDVIRRHGGDVLVNHEVVEIVLDRGRAVGVRAKGRGRRPEVEVRAGVVLSDVGARRTLGLLDDGVLPGLRAAVGSAASGVGSVVAYVGLTADPSTRGITPGNHWLVSGDSPAQDEAALLAGRPRAGYVSFPSAKDPGARRHTAEIVAHLDPAALSRWRGSSWLHRGAEYERLKDALGAGLVALAEERLPGFASLVERVEVSTPLTMTDLGGTSGGFAELAGTPQRFASRVLPARTGVPGLVMTGADVCSVGFAGALMGAAFSVGAVLGWRELGLLLRDPGRWTPQPPDSGVPDRTQSGLASTITSSAT